MDKKVTEESTYIGTFFSFDNWRVLEPAQQAMLDKYVEDFTNAIEKRLPDPEIPKEVTLLYTGMVPLVWPFSAKNPDLIIHELSFHENNSVDGRHVDISDLENVLLQHPHSSLPPIIEEALILQVTKALLQTHWTSVISKSGFDTLHCGISFQKCKTDLEGNQNLDGTEYVLGTIMIHGI